MQEVQGMLNWPGLISNWTVIRSPIDGRHSGKAGRCRRNWSHRKSFGGGRGPSTAFLAMADPKDLQVEVELNEIGSLESVSRPDVPHQPELIRIRAMRPRGRDRARSKPTEGTLQVKVQVREPDRFMTPELSAKVEFLAK